MFFLAILLLAAMFATLFVLIKGLVNMAGTTSQDLEGHGDGPSPRALKSQKLMQQRILLQAVAIAVAAIILFAMSAKG
ncbi:MULTISPECIES: twin transmembrane helix small protein [unclassified Sphingomonas]|jgi:Hypoxia induced protein conserved region|uniref:twin transmembrane helix small protein n=1 Tax=unclassified Sphingomonas TaxID=196159 RepID=UPI000B156DF5|nr:MULTISPECIES: twin transmembrane helix small protein [unclassified Sphingomonas]